MITVHSSLYAMAAACCMLLSLIAGNRRPAAAPTYRWLMAYLLLEAARFALEWLMLHPTSPGKSLWLGLLMAMAFLVPPCLWLFAREITEGTTPAVRSLPRSQLWLIGVGVALTLPLIQRAHWGTDFVDPAHPIGVGHRLFLQVTMAASALLFLVQAPLVVRACIRILAQHTNRTKALFSHIDSQPLNALRLLVLVALTNWLVSLLRVVHCMTLGKDTGLGVLFAAIEVAVTVGIVFTLARRGTSFDAEVHAVATSTDAPALAASANAGKYAKSSLDERTRERIRRKLEAALVQERVHADNALTLRALCTHLRENAHYVSQVINQDMDTSFYDLVNRHRIATAQAALAAHPDKPVIDIALEAGFNSKSTFNTAFRQHAGMTPTQYRRVLRRDS